MSKKKHALRVMVGLAAATAPAIWSQAARGGSAELFWSAPREVRTAGEVSLFGRGLPPAGAENAVTLRDAQGESRSLSVARSDGSRITVTLPADAEPGVYRLEVAGSEAPVTIVAERDARDVPAGAYGAFPNDGADDTAALAQAIDAAAPGDAVALEPGVYRLGGALRVRKAVTIRGSDETRIEMSTAEGVVAVEAADVRIAGIAFRGFPESERATIEAAAAEKLTVERCVFEGGGAAAILLAGAADARVVGNTFRGGRGVDAQGAAGLTIELNSFEVAAGAPAVALRGGAHLDISRNTAQLAGDGRFVAAAEIDNPAEQLYIGDNDIVRETCAGCGDPVVGAGAGAHGNRIYPAESGESEPKVTARSAAGEVDIANYGACSTYDAAGAVQRAIDALPSSGGVLTVSCMANIGGAGIRLTRRTNTVVRGVNGGGFRSLAKTDGLAAGVGPVMFAVNDCDSCTIENLRLNGNRVNNAVLGLRACDNTTVRNNVMSDIGSPVGSFGSEAPIAGMVAMGNRNNRYLDNRLTNTARWPGTDLDNGIRGFWFGNPNGGDVEYDAEIAGNTIVNTGYTSIAAHIARARIRRNTIDNAGYNGGCAGVKLVPPASEPGEALFEENTIRGHNCTGITLVNIQSNQSVVVRNNRLENNRYSGVTNDPGPFHNAIIVGNAITDNRGLGSGGITLHNGVNVTVEGNTVRDNRSGGSRTQMHGMTFANGGSFRDIRVRCNTFDNHPRNAIALWSGAQVSGLELSNNTYTSNGYGVFAESIGLSGLSSWGNAYSGNVFGTAVNLAAGAGTPSCGGSTATAPAPAAPTSPAATTGGGSATITVRAYGTPSGGVYPAMELRVGTQLLSTWNVSGSPQTFTYAGAWNPAGQKLRVHFTNDRVDGSGDRNLVVESVTLNGVTYLSRAPEVHSTGSWDAAGGCSPGNKQSQMLACNGYFEYPTPF